MIIDFHTHDFPAAIASKSIALLQQRSGITPYTDGTYQGLARSMEEGGIDVSILLPVVTKPSQFDTVNRVAARLNERQEAIRSFGGIHPENEDYREKLKEIKRMGLPGIKLHPAYQETYMDDIRYKRIVSYALEQDLLVVFHAGVDIGLPEPVYTDPERTLNLLRDTGGGNIILAHLGGWKCWDQVEELLLDRDVYFDTAFVQDFMSKEQFMGIVRGHGTDKILFGTDSPWSGQKESVEWLKSLPFSQEEQEQIFWENAKKLLKDFL